ncbi:MAG: DNA-directed RNA polymerase subunit alpha C-terminal domain-containing protein [Novosphingobium sp.]
MQFTKHNQLQIEAGKERRERILSFRKEGWSFNRIAAELRISPARAAQLHRRAQELEAQARQSVPISQITLQTPVHNLPLSTRTGRALRNGGYETFGELLPLDLAKRRELLGLVNFGRACIDELAALLSSTGLRND